MVSIKYPILELQISSLVRGRASSRSTASPTCTIFIRITCLLLFRRFYPSIVHQILPAHAIHYCELPSACHSLTCNFLTVSYGSRQSPCSNPGTARDQPFTRVLCRAD